MLLLFRAMTQQSDRVGLGQLLEQAQREFLAVILDRSIFPVNRPTFEEFLAITSTEPAPADLAGLYRPQQLLARTEVRHPDIISGRGHAAPTKPRGQNAQSILARFNRRGN